MHCLCDRDTWGIIASRAGQGKAAWVRNRTRPDAYLQKNCLNARNGVDALDHFLHHLVDVTIGGVENDIYLLSSS